MIPKYLIAESLYSILNDCWIRETVFGSETLRACDLEYLTWRPEILENSARTLQRLGREVRGKSGT